MSIWSLVIIGLTTFIGAFVQTNMGFGGGVILINVLPLFFPFGRALTIMQCCLIVMNISFAIIYWKKIKWDVLAPALIPGTVLAVFFTFISIRTAPALMNILIGFVFIFLAIFNLFLSDKFHVGKGPWVGAAMGIFSSLTNAFFGIAGPPIAAYLASSIDDKLSYFATCQVFFGFSSIACIVVRIVSGFILVSDIPLLLFMIGFFSIGALAGLKVMKKLSGEVFKKVIFAFVGANGLYIILKEILTK